MPAPRRLSVTSWALAAACFGCLVMSGEPSRAAPGDAALPDGWTTVAPRDEIRPAFSFEPSGGRSGKGGMVIVHDQREGLDGWFQKEVPVKGGTTYRFQAYRKVTGVATPRRSCLARLVWRNAKGNAVKADPPSGVEADGRPVWVAEPEHPADGATDARGWTAVGGTYLAPKGAARAVVELHLQWAPGGRVEWSDMVMEETSPPASRLVRLAAVHHRPSGRSPQSNREEFAPLIADAARQRADLVVLGEAVPAAGVKGPLESVAEPVPGPSTAYFGGLARTHRLHVVLGLLERDRHLIYNTAVLLGPDGQLIGKYRKVCLPHSEVEKGIAPGHEYPVFDTSIGKIGMMICYDGFFPEVARELSNRGAEVIAWPVWGCDPLLARARACENHVYLVSSTFTDHENEWMLTAVFDRSGRPMATAEKWGSVVVSEVDLGRPFIGPYNLGDFRSMVPRHRPEHARD